MFSLSAFYLCNSRLARARRPREDRDRGRPAWRIGRRRLEEPRQPAGRDRPAREGPLKRGRSRPEPPAPRERAKARKSPAPCAPRRRGQYRATPGTAEAADGRGRPPGARKAHPGAREVSPSAGGGASRRGGRPDVASVAGLHATDAAGQASATLAPRGWRERAAAPSRPLPRRESGRNASLRCPDHRNTARARETRRHTGSAAGDAATGRAPVAVPAAALGSAPAEGGGQAGGRVR